MSDIFKQIDELGRRRFMSNVARAVFGVGVGMPFLNPAMAKVLPNTDKKLIFL